MGYTIKQDSSGQGKGTALVIHRILTLKKRHYANARLVINRKRVKTKGAEKKKGGLRKKTEKKKGSFFDVLKGIGNSSSSLGGKAKRERLLINRLFTRD